MLKLVHLQFDKEAKNGWFRSTLSEHHLGQLCVAEIKDGLAVGKVDAVSEVEDGKMNSKVMSVLREATEEEKNSNPFTEGAGGYGSSGNGQAEQGDWSSIRDQPENS